ncbi:MAG: WbqC family protein [Ferruginibacter sp.]
MKKNAILQSNYIPWKGYFNLIDSVDEFIFYDEVQYTKNDWRNRNKIMTPAGPSWLTIPVMQTHLSQSINETKLLNEHWKKKHLGTIKQFYSGSDHYKDTIDLIAGLYADCHFEMLSEINRHFISGICNFLEIKTIFTASEKYGLIEGKTERLIDLVQKAGGTEYISGPAAKDYLNAELFKEAGIKLTWMDYAGYPEYPQRGPAFEHGVSVIDLILNTGADAKKYLQKGPLPQ